jgi:hypothetical protein
MIQIVLSFVVVFGLFFFGIRAVRNMTGAEQLDLAKLLTYSVLCAILTLGFLITIVVLF